MSLSTAVLSIVCSQKHIIHPGLYSAPLQFHHGVLTQKMSIEKAEAEVMAPNSMSKFRGVTSIYLVAPVCGTTGWVREEKFPKWGSTFPRKVISHIREHYRFIIASHPRTKIEGVTPLGQDHEDRAHTSLMIVIIKSKYILLQPNIGSSHVCEVST